MVLELANLAHQCDPVIDARKHPLEAFDSCEHETAGDLVVKDYVYDRGLIPGNQEVAATLQHRVDAFEDVIEEGGFGSFHLITCEVCMAERLRSHDHLDQALDARAQHARKPIHVLVDLGGVLARPVGLEARLRQCKVVGENACVAHQLAVIVNDHRDATQWIFRQICGLLVLPSENVDLLELIVDPTDVE